ncbi:MAG: 4Fe-4S dicluster domain-containing protein [Bacillota bacterium]
MSIKVNENKCAGCNNKKEPLCIKFCPGNLLKLSEDNIPEIRRPQDCWDCMVCVKACPHNALKTVLPYSLASYRATLTPEIKNNKIIWKTEDIGGNEEVFESPITREIVKPDKKYSQLS